MTLMNTFILFFQFGLIYFQNPINSRVDFLAGTWQVEGKQRFEFWESSTDNSMMGYVYKLTNGKEIKLEYLKISHKNQSIIYKAQVLDQNQGKAISFKLNKNIKQYLSFENEAHDFPKKIQYHPLSDTEILISVLGANDEGFSYKPIKQE